MKKSFVILSILLFSLSACANEKPIIFEQLPHAAQAFINTHFASLPIAYIEYEREGLREDYKVYFKNGTEIEFGTQGSFESVDCQRNAVPATIIPEAIHTYIGQYYPEAFVVAYSIDYRHLDVELNNGVDLVFDHAYKFIRIDD
jgi:hypothetical protein